VAIAEWAHDHPMTTTTARTTRRTAAATVAAALVILLSGLTGSSSGATPVLEPAGPPATAEILAGQGR
jgi:hypothetical protein